VAPWPAPPWPVGVMVCSWRSTRSRARPLSDGPEHGAPASPRSSCWSSCWPIPGRLLRQGPLRPARPPKASQAPSSCKHSSLRARLRSAGLRLCADRLDGLRLLCSMSRCASTERGLYYGSEGEPLKRFRCARWLGIRFGSSPLGHSRCRLSGAGRATAAGGLSRHSPRGWWEIQGQRPPLIVELADLWGVAGEQTAYLADDLNDWWCVDHVGLLLTPGDAPDWFCRRADLVLREPPRHGAIRDLAEALLNRRGRMEALLRSGLERNRIMLASKKECPVVAEGLRRDPARTTGSQQALGRLTPALGASRPFHSQPFAPGPVLIFWEGGTVLSQPWSGRPFTPRSGVSAKNPRTIRHESSS